MGPAALAGLGGRKQLQISQHGVKLGNEPATSRPVGESTPGVSTHQRKPRCSPCCALRSRVPPRCCPARPAGVSRPLDGRALCRGAQGSGLQSRRGPGLQSRRGPARGGRQQRLRAAGSAGVCPPWPSQRAPGARCEKPWRSKPKPLGVALGASPDTASVLSSRPPFGQASLCVLGPESRTASARRSGLRPRAFAHALPAWSASPPPPTSQAPPEFTFDSTSSHQPCRPGL